MISISRFGIFYNDPYNELIRDICEIESDVWIGIHSIILHGAKIGQGVVIGANSVVTKDIPYFAVVVGSSAKIIKYRFNDEKI